LHSSAALIAKMSDLPVSPPVDGQEAPALLMNLELALPGSEPRRRARALHQSTGALGTENLPVASALAGYNLLAAGDATASLLAFRSALKTHPEDVALWEGVRAAAELVGDRATVAEACAALGDAVRDDARGAEMWERSAKILIEELEDPQRGDFALSRAVARDVTRFSSFDRLFRIVRSKKDGPRLLDLISERLEVAEDLACARTALGSNQRSPSRLTMMAGLCWRGTGSGRPATARTWASNCERSQAFCV
jgi:chorismate mutase